MSPTSQLMSAILSTDNETVSKLLEKMDIEVINMKEDFETALHMACDNKNHDALDLLLAKNGIDVNVKNKTGWTPPLHTACHKNNFQAVAKLLDRPEIEMNAKSSTCGWAPLHISRSNRNNLLIAANMLDSPGIDVNIKSFIGRTPLHLTCRKNLQSIVRKLLASPVLDVSARDVLGDTPIMDSAECCNKDALNLMLDDTRVNLDIKDEKGRRLEERVRSSIYYSKEGKDACLEMIKNERMRRENKEMGQEQTSQAEGIEKHLVKIEKINKEIGMEEGKRKKNFDIRKRKMEDLDGKQTVDKKILAKKHKEESSLLENNRRHAITVLQETSAREDHDEQRYIASLKEHRDELSQELEKLTIDAGNEAFKPDEISKLEHIKRSLECPVCMELMRPPAKILMCRFTHVICEVCKDRLKPEGGICPTCITEPFIGRNYMAENLARTVFNV